MHLVEKYKNRLQPIYTNYMNLHSFGFPYYYQIMLLLQQAFETSTYIQYHIYLTTTQIVYPEMHTCENTSFYFECESLLQACIQIYLRKHLSYLEIFILLNFACKQTLHQLRGIDMHDSQLVSHLKVQIPPETSHKDFP